MGYGLTSFHFARLPCLQIKKRQGLDGPIHVSQLEPTSWEQVDNNMRTLSTGTDGLLLAAEEAAAY